MSGAGTILAVDDEVSALRSVRRTLRSKGFETVLTTADSREVMPLLEQHSVDLLLLDLIMPHLGGEEVLEAVMARYPELPVIVITAEQEVRTAVHCMKLGAMDYLVKPVAGEHLVAAVRRALEQSALRYENARLKEQLLGGELERPEAFSHIITADPAMHRLFGYLEAISRGSQPVLIVGETGTGKELVARALHQACERTGPFVAVNVAGLDDAMFADTLFGHRPGAFTGASSSRQGMIERAGEGTLFLDEIGDLKEASQVKLLRLLQEREYFPLGSDSPRPLQARVVAATHQNPADLRQDLYFRLRSYFVRIPPLRDRRGDLPLLVDHFLALAAEDLHRAIPPVPAELYSLLESYEFPGNVRELQAVVFDALAHHGSGALPLEPVRQAIGVEEAPGGEGFPEPRPAPCSEAERPRILDREAWRNLEKANLEAALTAAGGKIAGHGGAAELLDVKPTTLESRMKVLGIEKSAFRVPKA